MIDSGYYIAVVKEEVETDADNRVGIPKTKTMTYNYIVKQDLSVLLTKRLKTICSHV